MKNQLTANITSSIGTTSASHAPEPVLPVKKKLTAVPPASTAGITRMMTLVKSSLSANLTNLESLMTIAMSAMTSVRPVKREVNVYPVELVGNMMVIVVEKSNAKTVNS